MKTPERTWLALLLLLSCSAAMVTLCALVSSGWSLAVATVHQNITCYLMYVKPGQGHPARSYNHQRLLEPIGNILPAEAEEHYYQQRYGLPSVA
jgi:hypothetical protein